MITNYVVDANNTTRHKWWRHWCACVYPLCINPFLQTTASKEVIFTTTRFTDRVQRGRYRNGKRVTVQTPQVALSSISNTIDLEIGVGPIYQRDNKDIVLIQRQIEGYRSEDLPTTHKLDVPVATNNTTYKIKNYSNNAAVEAAGQLCIFTFYFILSIGEYTLPRMTNQGKRATITLQVRIFNIGFWPNGNILPQQSPLHLLRQADSATMNIKNQKNGWRLQIIHQKALTNGKPLPIQSLSEHVHHILSNGGSNDDSIAVVYSNGVKAGINPQKISKTIKSSVQSLGL